ncbi:MAG: DNA translocase FtsK 4TM domain-containing protein, partial [Burkholderiaceae bacterium]
MTYSLHTLTSSSSASAPARPGASRFAHEIGLILGLLALLFWLLALLSYSAQDAAWSTSGRGGAIANWGGRLGAWLADASYFLLGFSVWWCFVAGVRAWLASLARWMRGHELARPEASAASRLAGSRGAFWWGLALLLYASTALEWARMYRFEPRLPGHGGGVLGYLVGPASVKWLGFNGSGLVCIALGVIGAALVFRFSWGHVAERLGAWIDSLIESRREKREMAEDLALGKQAAREREEVVFE